MTRIVLIPTPSSDGRTIVLRAVAEPRGERLRRLVERVRETLRGRPAR
jgi:hypothetical protein